MDDGAGAPTHPWQDKLELAELVAVLAAAVDRADRERIVDCYAVDSFDDHGVFKGSGGEFADFICGPGLLTSMHHLLGQSVFEVEGDEAWGETYFGFHGAAGSSTVVGHGRYVDYFRRTEQGWRLAYRRVVPDTVPAGDELGSYWSSHRDRTDPSYDRRRRPPGTSAGP